MGKLGEVRDPLKGFSSVTFEWVPREQNIEADLLSRIAYEKHKKERAEQVNLDTKRDAQAVGRADSITRGIRKVESAHGRVI